MFTFSTIGFSPNLMCQFEWDTNQIVGAEHGSRIGDTLSRTEPLTVSRLGACPLVLLLLQRAELRLAIVRVSRRRRGDGGCQFGAVGEVIVEVAPNLLLL